MSYTEFLAAALSKQVYTNETRVREAFDRLDHDSKGYITASNL